MNYSGLDYDYAEMKPEYPDKIVFSNFTKIYKFKTNYAEDSRGLGTFNSLSNFLINHIVSGDDPIPAEYLYIDDYHFHLGPKSKSNQWLDLMFKNVFFLIFIALFLFLSFLMLAIGVFLCCRCKKQMHCTPFAKKGDKCRRFLFNSLLALLCFFIIMLVLYALLANLYMEDGLKKSREVIHEAADDVQFYIQNVAAQYYHVILENYSELQEVIERTLELWPHNAVKKLENQTALPGTADLDNFMINLPEIDNKLNKLNSIAFNVRILSDQICDGLRGVKRELLNIYIDVSLDQKPRVKFFLDRNNIKTLGDNFHMDNLDSQKEAYEGVKEIMNWRIPDAVKNKYNNFQNLVIELNNTFYPAQQQLLAEFASLVPILESFANVIKRQMYNVSIMIGDHGYHTGEFVDDYLNPYAFIRFYLGVLTCVALLIIVICLLTGLLYGIFGRYPDKYRVGGFNKATGANLLEVAAGLIMISFIIIAIIMLLYFCIGIIMYRGVCVPLQDKSDYISTNLLDPDLYSVNNIRFKREKQIFGDLPVNHVVTHCYANETIFKVLLLHRALNFDLLTFSDILSAPIKNFDDIMDNITIKFPEIQIYSDADWKLLNQLRVTKLNKFDGDMYKDYGHVLKDTQFIERLAKECLTLANQLNQPTNRKLQASLRNQAKHLRKYDKELYQDLQIQVSFIKELADYVTKNINMRNQPFKDVVPDILDEVRSTQTRIKNETNERIKSYLPDVQEYCTELLMKYDDHVMYQLEHIVGKCGPCMHVYAVAVKSVCGEIVGPMNVLWLSLCLSLLLFLPILCIVKQLICLYRIPSQCTNINPCKQLCLPLPSSPLPSQIALFQRSCVNPMPFKTSTEHIPGPSCLNSSKTDPSLAEGSLANIPRETFSDPAVSGSKSKLD